MVKRFWTPGELPSYHRLVRYGGKRYLLSLCLRFRYLLKHIGTCPQRRKRPLSSDEDTSSERHGVWRMQNFLHIVNSMVQAFRFWSITRPAGILPADCTDSSSVIETGSTPSPPSPYCSESGGNTLLTTRIAVIVPLFGKIICNLRYRLLAACLKTGSTSYGITTKHSIHLPPTLGRMTPEDFFYHVFEFLPRQGPGCTGATKKAWSILPPIPDRAQILDIGCGSGAQTRDLAVLSTGTITAVDNHQPFLDAIRAQSGTDGTDGRIKTVCASMEDLPFEKGQFDLVWSEGAIFIMGFEKGLRTWKPFVKKSGFIVVSDAAWFEQNPPQELVQWWEKEGYIPRTEDQLKELVRNAGLRLIATYRLPEAGWWDNYYVPMLARIDELRKIHGSDPAFAAILDSFQHEAETYRKYKRHYGYTFFIMQNL